MPETTRKTPWAWVVATFFGAGLLKPGPGTYGSVAATALWYIVFHSLQPLGAMPRFVLTLAAALVVTLIGIPAATIVARESGREDPSHVVIDEVAGQLIVLSAARTSVPFAILALLLFRVFDIWKPWPVRRLEDLPEGTGIMCDDLAAGIYGFLVYCILALPFARMLQHFGLPA